MDMISLALDKAAKFESEGKVVEAEHWLDMALKAETREKNKAAGVVVKEVEPVPVV